MALTYGVWNSHIHSINTWSVPGTVLDTLIISMNKIYKKIISLWRILAHVLYVLEVVGLGHMINNCIKMENCHTNRAINIRIQKNSLKNISSNDDTFANMEY